jgi:hypothetical protein
MVPLQDLVGVVFHFDFLWSNDTRYYALGIRDKGCAEDAHIRATSHFLLAIYTEFLHEFEVGVAEKWEGKLILLYELMMRFGVLCAAT